jgi:hypothetical protein
MTLDDLVALQGGVSAKGRTGWDVLNQPARPSRRTDVGIGFSGLAA